jgi:hypothetical protein
MVITQKGAQLTITAKFPGKCRSCGGRIAVGEQVEWEKGKGAAHNSCPATATPVAVKEVTVTQPGVYEHPTDGIYIVKPNQQKTRLYAKRLVEITGNRLTEADEVVQIDFEYEQGAVYKLTPEMKMPLERAKELTVRYGRCIVCGAHLTDAKSVERGIGPVCIKSFAVAA